MAATTTTTTTSSMVFFVLSLVLMALPLASHAGYAGPAMVEVTLLSFRTNGTYCMDQGSDVQPWDNGCDIQIEFCPKWNTTTPSAGCLYGGPRRSQIFRNTNRIFTHLTFQYFVPDFSQDSAFFSLSAFDIDVDNRSVPITSGMGSAVGVASHGWIEKLVNGSIQTSEGLFEYTVFVRRVAGSAVVTMTLVDGWSNSNCDGCCFNFKKCDLFALICAQDYASGALGNCLYRGEYKTGFVSDENYRRFSDVITFFIPYYTGGFATSWTLKDDDVGSSDYVTAGYLSMALKPSTGSPLQEMKTGDGTLRATVSVACVLTQDDACVDRCYANYYQVGSTCVPCTACGQGQVNIGGCSGTRDSQCANITSCISGIQYEVESPTWTSNPVCANCSVPCSDGEYTLRDCSGSYDLECRRCRVCAAHEFEASPCNAFSNRVCNTTTVCDPTFEQETVPPTATSDRVCKNCSSRFCDSIPPLITLLGSQNMTIEFGSVFEDPGFQIVDDGNGSFSDVIGLPLNTSALGVHIITYTAIDAAGNSAFADRFVTVVDTTPPQCMLMGPDVMVLEAGFPYSDPGVRVFDLADNDPAVVVSPSQVNTKLVGEVEVTYRVTDASGNTVTRVRLLVIRDTQGPIITLIGNPTLFIDINKPFSDPGATASDLAEGDLTSKIVVHGLEGGVSTAGPAGRTFSYNYSCSDSHGNAAAVVQRFVQIVDNSPPRFVLNGSEVNIVIIVGNSFNVSVVVIDNSNNDITKNVTVVIIFFADKSSSGVPVSSVDTSKTGRYQIAYTATDPQGQSSTLLREVSVVQPDGSTRSDDSPNTTMIVVLTLLACLILIVLIILALVWRHRKHHDQTRRETVTALEFEDLPPLPVKSDAPYGYSPPKPSAASGASAGDISNQHTNNSLPSYFARTQPQDIRPPAPYPVASSRAPLRSQFYEAEQFEGYPPYHHPPPPDYDGHNYTPYSPSSDSSSIPPHPTPDHMTGVSSPQRRAINPSLHGVQPSDQTEYAVPHRTTVNQHYGSMADSVA